MNDHMIEKILKETKTIAVVGISSNDERPGFTVPAYLQSRGYRIIPVNPHLEYRLGEKAYPDLRSIPYAVDLVLLFRRSEAVPPFIDDAILIGAKAVWMQLGVIHETAAAKARKAGLDVVMDKCMAIEHHRQTGRSLKDKSKLSR